MPEFGKYGTGIGAAIDGEHIFLEEYVATCPDGFQPLTLLKLMHTLRMHLQVVWQRQQCLEALSGCSYVSALGKQPAI